jgi:hypothetical protein
MKKLFLSGIAALFLATGAAHATADGCAVVLKTSDGFLNLRKDPSMKARIIARLKPGAIIYITDLACPPLSHCDNKGEWTHVSDVPASRECAEKYAGDRLENQLDYERCLNRVGLRDGASGWVGTRFVVSVDCERLEYRGEER